MKENHSDFILFKTEDEKISVDVRFEEETVWLTQEQMALLFGKAKSTINEHIQNVFNEGELDESLCIQKFGISEFQKRTPDLIIEYQNQGTYHIYGTHPKRF